MHVATLAAGGSLDCSFDKIHNLIISYNVYMYLFIYAYNISKLEIITPNLGELNYIRTYLLVLHRYDF